MPKVLEDSLGNLEYLLLGLTFLGVLYLVMKQANLSVSVSKDQFVSNHGIRFLTEDDAGNRAGYYPKQKGYEGMSLSGYEPPVWHAAAYDPSELDQLAQLDQEPDYGKPVDGMRGGYARKAVEAMDNKLTSAMLGGNAGLQ